MMSLISIAEPPLIFLYLDGADLPSTSIAIDLVEETAIDLFSASFLRD